LRSSLQSERFLPPTLKPAVKYLRDTSQHTIATGGGNGDVVHTIEGNVIKENGHMIRSCDQKECHMISVSARQFLNEVITFSMWISTAAALTSPGAGHPHTLLTADSAPQWNPHTPPVT